MFGTNPYQRHYIRLYLGLPRRLRCSSQSVLLLKRHYELTNPVRDLTIKDPMTKSNKRHVLHHVAQVKEGAAASQLAPDIPGQIANTSQLAGQVYLLQEPRNSLAAVIMSQKQR